MKPRSKQIAPGTVKRLLSYITGKYRTRFTAVLICVTISAAAGTASSMFIRRLIDDYIPEILNGVRLFSGAIGGSPPLTVFAGLIEAIAVMCAIYLTGIAATLIYNRTMAIIAQGVLKTIRDEMFEHMQTLPVKYFDTHTHGDVMSYYTNDADTLRQMISISIPQLFASVISMFTVFFAMLYLSVPLTLIVLVFLGIMLIAARIIGGRAGTYFFRQQQSIADVSGYIEEMVHGQKVVKIFCHEDEAKEKFDALNDSLNDNAAAANAYANILMPVIVNLSYLQYAFVAVLGGWLSLNGVSGITLGTIAAFLTLSRSFSMPIGQVSQQLNSIIMALAGAGRIFGFIDEKPEYDDGYVALVNAEYADGRLTEARSKTKHTGIWAWKHPHQTDGSVTYTELKGRVELHNVDFSYVENKPVLRDVSLYAKPGQKIAFVGATGAGKTTITNLLNRFYDIEDGKIRYDGININKIRKPDLRRSLGVVLQDVSLFTGTIMENIRYGKLDATDDECIHAAKLSNAHDFISRLPQGYDTVIDGGGGNLSQGQRQLISIARAAVADPPVMILDEATSSIDTRTEALVQQGMDGLMEGRTVFVIAHRLSTVKNSKAIIVLEHGSVIERGDHNSLVADKGRYYRLYTGEFEME